MSLNGSSQHERFLQALDSHYFRADERGSAELLFFASRLSQFIQFYGLDNQADGDWSDFFLSDSSVVFAQILLFDEQKQSKAFQTALWQAQESPSLLRKMELLADIFRLIFELAQKIDEWYKNLHLNLSKKQAFASQLENIIEVQLGKNFAQFNIHLQQAQTWGLDYKNDYHFQKIWYKSENLLALPAPEVEQMFYALDSIFQTFYEAISFLKIKAKDFFSQSMQESHHSPHMAMFLAFIELFKLAQNTLNDFGKRHLQFYYEQVLQMRRKSFLEDNIYLCLRPQPDVDRVFVPKGTPFFFKEDENARPILYYSQEDLLVNHGKIEHIYTDFVEEKILNLRDKTRRIVNNVYSKAIAEQHFKGNKNVKELTTWSLFGESQRGKGIYERSMENARLGWAVAAPILFLQEGDREITLSLQFSKNSFQNFVSVLQDISESTGDSTEEVFIKTFIDAFRIEVSSPVGWFHIERYAVNKDHSAGTLSIRFGLSSNEIPLANYDEAVHRQGFETIFPCVQIFLNDDSYVYPYSLLEVLELCQIKIDVKVKEVRKLSLYNNLGILNADAPFYPFTPVPTLGSYLLIGSAEVFNKALDKLVVHIEWFDLPRDKAGFFGHYLGYKDEIDNSVFEVRLSRLSAGKWIPEQEYDQQIFPLFRTQEQGESQPPRPRGALHKISTFENINLAQIQMPPDYLALNQNLQYTNTTQRAFIKLELCHPENSFCHQIYPFLLSEITLENTLAKNRLLNRQAEIPMPKAPYAPQIKRISLDYESSYIINLQENHVKIPQALQAQIYHLHPFGYHKIHPQKEIQTFSLIPKFNYEGSLNICIADIRKGESISLLFHLIDEFTVSSEEEPPQIEWFYLSNNQWLKFKKSAILLDTTNNFLNSGIIKIEVPSEIDWENNTIFSKNKFWIKAAGIANVQEASSVILVGSQALLATWKNQDNTAQHLERPTPAFSVKKAFVNISGLQTVTQPLDAFGGKSHENQQQFYTRVAERLRHKKRAITIWDYENLVLEHFPFVYQVKCLPNTSSQSLKNTVGKVMLVVIINPALSLNPYEPMASNQQLYEIKSFLEKHTSPFIKIEVRNPSYERIKIHVDIKFSAGKNNGIYMRMLEEEVKNYLCAWLPPYHKGLRLGGQVHKADVMNFISSRPYVEFITKFSLTQTAQDEQGRYILIDTASHSNPTEVLSATKAWAVLVPAPQSSFEITYLSKEQAPQQSGTGFLQISTDFIIG